MSLPILIFDIYWTFILPVICFFSLITNGINILVFFRIKSHDLIYKYMLFNSMADEVYLFGVLFIFLVRCGQFCQIKDTYLVQVYAHYIYMYATNSVALFSVFLEIMIILQRYFTLKNKTFLKNVNKTLFLIYLLIFSFVYHIPQLSVFEIERKNQTFNSTFVRVIYTRTFVANNKSFIERNLLAFQTLMRLILSIIIMVLLYKLTTFALKKYEAIQQQQNNSFEISSKTETSSERSKNYYFKIFFSTILSSFAFSRTIRAPFYFLF